MELEQKAVESKHTPGPWTIDERRIRDGYYAAINAPKWYALADVVVRMSDEEEDTPEGVANAKLIAAAPDLLALLKEWDEPGACGCDTATCRETCLPARTRAAIAKATVATVIPLSK